MVWELEDKYISRDLSAEHFVVAEKHHLLVALHSQRGGVVGQGEGAWRCDLIIL